MSWISGLIHIVKEVSEAAIGGAVTGVGKLIGMDAQYLITQGDEEPDRPLVTANTDNNADIYINQQGDAKKRLVETVYLRARTLCPYIAPLKRDTYFDLNYETTFFFGNKSGIKTMEDGNKYRVIGPNDHGVLLCVPNLFKGFDNLRRYEMFRVESITLHITSASSDRVTNVIKFLPISIDTDKFTNEQLSTITQGSDVCSGLNGTFVKLLNSGNFYKYEYDKETMNYKNLKGVTGIINPDPIFRTEYVIEAFNRKENPELLSFGSFIILSSNLSEKDVAYKFKVTMKVNVISQFNDVGIINYKDEDGENNDDGDNDGGNGDDDGQGGNDDDNDGSSGSTNVGTSRAIPLNRRRKR